MLICFSIHTEIGQAKNNPMDILEMNLLNCFSKTKFDFLRLLLP